MKTCNLLAHSRRRTSELASIAINKPPVNKYETCIRTADERLYIRKDSRSYLRNQTVKIRLDGDFVQSSIFFRFFFSATAWLTARIFSSIKIPCVFRVIQNLNINNSSSKRRQERPLSNHWCVIMPCLIIGPHVEQALSSKRSIFNVHALYFKTDLRRGSLRVQNQVQGNRFVAICYACY